MMSPVRRPKLRVRGDECEEGAERQGEIGPSHAVVFGIYGFFSKPGMDEEGSRQH